MRDDRSGDLLIGGGVAANGRLRALLAERAGERGISLRTPRPNLCTDNGAMIAVLGAEIVASAASRPPSTSEPTRQCRSARSWCELLRHIPTHVPVFGWLRSVSPANSAPVCRLATANVSLPTCSVRPNCRKLPCRRRCANRHSLGLAVPTTGSQLARATMVECREPAALGLTDEASMRQRRRRIPNRWQPLLGCAPVRSRACGDCARQATLRRQARTKFGEAAAEMFFTRGWSGAGDATRGR